MVKVELIFPIENYTLYGEDLKLRYKLVNNLKKYNVYQIVFSLDGGEIIKDTELSGSYTFSSLVNGEHTILGYLTDINNKKIEQSNFSITFNVLFKEHTPENVTWQLSKSKLPEFIQEDFKTFSRFLLVYLGLFFKNVILYFHLIRILRFSFLVVATKGHQGRWRGQPLLSSFK
jgi:hypothetical protein